MPSFEGWESVRFLVRILCCCLHRASLSSHSFWGQKHIFQIFVAFADDLSSVKTLKPRTVRSNSSPTRLRCYAAGCWGDSQYNEHILSSVLSPGRAGWEYLLLLKSFSLISPLKEEETSQCLAFCNFSELWVRMECGLHEQFSPWIEWNCLPKTKKEALCGPSPDLPVPPLYIMAVLVKVSEWRKPPRCAKYEQPRVPGWTLEGESKTTGNRNGTTHCIWMWSAHGTCPGVSYQHPCVVTPWPC